MLAQLDENGQKRVVHYLSRKLTDFERKWDTREEDLFAVAGGHETLRPYLIGKEFSVETDRANLRWLMEGKRTGGLSRWVLRLQQFSFKS